LECGFTEFTVPERELSVLITHTAVEGAVVSEDTRTVFEAKEKAGAHPTGVTFPGAPECL
jgi:hypothetical protein